MTDLESQLARIRTGQMYNDLTPELVAAREQAVLLTNAYNSSFSRPAGEREAILVRLFGSLGSRVHFEPTFRCEFGRNIHIGNNFYANFDCVMLDGGGIYIGDDVLLAPRVWIGAGVHLNPGVTMATTPSSARAAS